jgi:hypothetical protein
VIYGQVGARIRDMKAAGADKAALAVLLSQYYVS